MHPGTIPRRPAHRPGRSGPTAILAAVRRPALLLALLAALAPAPALTACDVGEDEGRPAQFGDAGGEDAPERGGFADFALLSVATTNTTRLGGADAATDAAGVASAAFPATSPETRPNAVVLVDAAD